MVRGMQATATLSLDISSRNLFVGFRKVELAQLGTDRYGVIYALASFMVYPNSVLLLGC